MRDYNGRKDFTMLSDYDLSQQLNQLIDWANLSENAKQMLATVSRRMEFADHTTPLVPYNGGKIWSHTFEVDQDRPFMYSLEGAVDDLFRDRIHKDVTARHFVNELCGLVGNNKNLQFHHNGPFCANFSIVVTYAMIQHNEDFSDFRVLCFSKPEHGTVKAVMISRGDVYPFYVRFDGEPRKLTQDDFLFWSYNEVYRDVTIDTVSKVITYNMHMYNAGKAVQYMHEIKG